MPDLEQRIAAWRAEFARILPGRGDEIQELEDHLREHFEALMAAGASVDAAFEAAVQRVGPPELLVGQYPPRSLGRENAASAVRRVLWGWGIVCGVIFLLLPFHRPPSWDTLLWVHGMSLIIGNVAILGLGTVGLIAQVRSIRRGPTEGERREFDRGMLKFAVLAVTFMSTGLVLGVLWSSAHLNRIWAWSPRDSGFLMVLVLLLIVTTTLIVSLRREAGFRAKYATAFANGVAGYLGFMGTGSGIVPIGFAILCLGIAISQLVLVLIRSTPDSRAIE